MIINLQLFSLNWSSVLLIYFNFLLITKRNEHGSRSDLNWYAPLEVCLTGFTIRAVPPYFSSRKMERVAKIRFSSLLNC